MCLLVPHSKKTLKFEKKLSMFWKTNAKINNVKNEIEYEEIKHITSFMVYNVHA